jgi:CRISPR system Cascade subunit CasB
MSKGYLSFKKDSPEVRELIEWWKGLDEDRGERAVLRRSHNLAEVAFSPAYHRLRLALNHFGKVDDDRLALIVALLARVKSGDDGNSIAEQMAAKKVNVPDSPARVSGLRFRRLLKVKDQEDLFVAMTRIIALLGGCANIQSLAQSVYYWNDITRKQWAFDYYSKAPNEA